MFDYVDAASDKDLSKHRVLEIKNQADQVINKIHIERRDPYGMIHVWLDKGRWPDKSELNGMFTTYEYAEKAIERYLVNRNEAVSEIRQVKVQDPREERIVTEASLGPA